MSTNRTNINRANSQRSTGPRTEAGKHRASQNALRHGLTAQLVVMPGEDPKAYEAHLKSFADEYQPQGATEAQLVQSLADTSWRLNRVVSIETNLLSHPTSARTEPFRFPRLEVQRLRDAAITPLDQSKALANLSLHSQRLSREFERTVAQLRKLQETRRNQEKIKVSPPKDGFVFTEPEFTQLRRASKPARMIEKPAKPADARDVVSPMRQLGAISARL